MCTVHESKKYILFYSSPPIKKLLNFLSLRSPLSLSLSHSTLILSQNSLNLSSSHPLSVTLLSPSIASPSQAADRLTVPSHRSPIASLSQAADRLTIPSRRLPHCPKLPIADRLTVPSRRSSHRHSPLCRPSSPTHPFCRPSSPTLILFVFSDC